MFKLSPLSMAVAQIVATVFIALALSFDAEAAAVQAEDQQRLAVLCPDGLYRVHISLCSDYNWSNTDVFFNDTVRNFAGT